MRISREDEGIDAERRVFADALGDRLGIADESGAGTAAHKADAGPEIGADLERAAPPAMQVHHALLAHGVEAREGLLGGGDLRVADIADEIVGGGPGERRRLADDDVEADAEAQRPP